MAERTPAERQADDTSRAAQRSEAHDATEDAASSPAHRTMGAGGSNAPKRSSSAPGTDARGRSNAPDASDAPAASNFERGAADVDIAIAGVHRPEAGTADASDPRTNPAPQAPRPGDAPAQNDLKIPSDPDESSFGGPLKLEG